MAHKKKNHKGNDRKSFRYRVRNNIMTDEDKARIEKRNQASQESKNKGYVMHKHQNSKSDFISQSRR